MKVLHLAWDGHLGGVQRYLLDLVKSIHWKNVDHGLVLFNGSGRILSQETLPECYFAELQLSRGSQLLSAIAKLKEQAEGQFVGQTDSPVSSGTCFEHQPSAE